MNNSTTSDVEFMNHAFKGNTAATDYILAISKAADVFDNLIDKDTPVSDSDVINALWLLAVEIPRNPFFQAHANDLLPVTATGITNWLVANQIERSVTDGRAIEIAHVIRYSIADVALMVALLCGGREWAAEVGPELRLRSQRSDLNEYINSLGGINHAA